MINNQACILVPFLTEVEICIIKFPTYNWTASKWCWTMTSRDRRVTYTSKFRSSSNYNRIFYSLSVGASQLHCHLGHFHKRKKSLWLLRRNLLVLECVTHDEERGTLSDGALSTQYFNYNPKLLKIWMKTIHFYVGCGRIYRIYTVLREQRYLLTIGELTTWGYVCCNASFELNNEFILKKTHHTVRITW